MNIQTPIYRAKKIDSDEYVEGFLTKVEVFGKGKSILGLPVHSMDGEFRWKFSIQGLDKHYAECIDPLTLAINYPNMIDNKGNKVFASLSEDGLGGDEVEGYCRDCNGDELQIMHKPVNFKGVVRFYNETVMGVVIETQDEIIIPCENCKPLVIKAGEPLRWSDCRQNIKVTGIKIHLNDKRRYCRKF